MIESSVKIRRFSSVQRLFHFGLIILFMLLSVTGMAWMYFETSWGKGLAALFGGYENTLEVHRIAGLVMLAGFVGQIVYLITKIDWSRFPGSLFDADSLIWRWQDFANFFVHAGWVIGVVKETPYFDRWSWWEKFDYWAVWWGLIIVGVTGLMLYDPILSAEYMPGWMFNIALWVHRIEAVLAMAHIFTIHFFVEHFRRSVFPFSATMFDGGMTVEHIRHEHPAWLDRLEKEGRLEEMVVPEPPIALRIIYFGFGYAMILLGLFLLVYGIINVFLLTL